MRIAIYGDSYAERRHGPESGAWWRVLETLGHDVTCYAESSSSFVWSAQLVDAHAHEYDFNIWCTTAIGRYSIELSDRTWLHLSSGSFVQGLAEREKDPEKSKVISVFNDYIKYMYRSADDDFVFKSLCEFSLTKHKNLMIVPGFRISDLTRFHLSDISALEEDRFFASLGDTYVDFHKHYEDKRVCHMSRENNQILAGLINQDLRHGIFSADLKHFVTPSDPQTIFEKK